MTAPKAVVVVGASLAGLRAVEALRRRGFAGRVTWIGDEPHRPYDRPPLSKQVLRGEWAPERTALKVDYAALEADLRLGVRAVSLDARDRHVLLGDGSAVAYEGLVIATGGTARDLAGSAGLTGVHTLRTLDDATAIRSALGARPKVAVVGAGFIGLEVAASCRALGLEVTVVETARVPLGAAIGETMGEAVAELHRAQGVTVRMGVAVERFIGDRAVAGLYLADGTTVDAELVVVGIGVVPETRWLEGSGIVLEGGVRCDEHSATNLPGVVACGDVARWTNPLFGEAMRVEHWTNAVEQADAAVAFLLDGDSAAPFAPVPYFWSDQYDAKIQFAGRVAPGDELCIMEGTVRERNLVALYGRAGRLRGVLTVNKPGALIRYRRALSVGAAFERLTG
jgi:NADPH-dependent 2,4-dienoyl-CoA reductase/sulfur reductase-like enzyme